MGAECVRLSPKPQTLSYKSSSREPLSLRGSQQVLQFEIAISNLQLHCSLSGISQVLFRVKGCFQLSFGPSDLTIHEKIIKSSANINTTFHVNAKDIQFLNFQTLILDSQGQVTQKMTLKMHAVCEGPKHHDHLLKEMKARIIFNLDINQIVGVELLCSSFLVHNYDYDGEQPEYAYSMELLSGNEEEAPEKKLFVRVKDVGEIQKNIRKTMSTKNLKQSIIKISLFKIFPLQVGQQNEEIFQISFPYLKFSQSNNACILADQEGRQIEKRKTFYTEQIKKGPKILGNVQMEIVCNTSKVYLEQMDCLIYSQEGVKIMSPLELSGEYLNNPQRISKKDLEPYVKILKKQKRVSYQNKNLVQNALKECYHFLKKAQNREFCRMENIPEMQLTLVDLLTSLGALITEGEDVTNEKIWDLIDIIIHRPELSPKCLYLIEKKQTKQTIGLKYYTFICNVISKIILCTTVGLQFRELQCTQKFIAYTYFRFPWIQNILINALKRENDQILTDEKLMEIGAYQGCRSPAKTVLYDWQQCMYLEIKNISKYKQIHNELLEIHEDVPRWAEVIFNRDDEQLFYGLLIELWKEAEMFLNYNGKILWEYFPYYGDLLGAFLGEMNTNQIIQYSPHFMECSIKLMQNEKLLNIFIKLLFQKTHLYKIYYVVKALEIIRHYFEVLSKSNKKIPKQFNFSYFYTGIRSILESNHSILLVKVLTLLYDYYHIFSMEFKNTLNKFILKRAFFQIFLHWCGYVRNIFYLFLEHRIVVKFQNHDKSICESYYKSEARDLTCLYNDLISSLEHQEKIMKQSEICLERKTKGVYHLQMKQKLHEKMRRPRTPEKFKNSSMSYSMLTPSPPEIRRHQMSAEDFFNTETKINRKYSVGTQFSDLECYQTISENNKKYLIVGMKQYRLVKTEQNPDKKVHQILKRYEGGNKETEI